MSDNIFDFNVSTAMQLASASYRLSTASPEGLNVRATTLNVDEYNQLFDGSTNLELATDLSVVDGEGYFIRDHGAALIALAGDTLYLTFRGTNDNSNIIGAIADTYLKSAGNSLPDEFVSPDVVDWFDMDYHFSLFSELFSALPDYIEENGITKIMLSGHSLGGGMVQKAFLEIRGNSAFSGVDVGGFAFAPPGYEQDLNPLTQTDEPNPKLLNVFFENDPLLKINALTSSIGDTLLLDGDGTGSHNPGDYVTITETLLSLGLKGGNQLQNPENTPEILRSDIERLSINLDDLGVYFLTDSANDGVIGTAGDDEIIVSRDFFRAEGFLVAGLRGDDEINLSSGEDFLVYRKGDDSDTVEDFNPNEDTLVLYGFSSPLDVQLSSFNVFPFSHETTVNFGDGDSITFRGLDLVEVDGILQNNVVVDNPSGSEIQIVGLDSDGPLQSNSAPYLDGSDNAAGTIGMSAPTFMGDGDVEYTVSLSGIGQGLQYNIAYIIDVSGSMDGQRIVDARNAYIELTNQLKALGITDVANFAVIPFNSGSTLYADLTADEAIARISSLGAGGGTSFGPALSDAQTFFSSANTGQTNIAYFLSDGQGSGASDFLTDIANVQAFGIGSGANLGALNIIDSDDAISLTSSSQLVDVLTGSGASVDEIDGIAISVDGNVVDFITPDQLVDGPLGLQYTGTISGLDTSPDAQNEVTATVFLKGVDGAKGSTTLSIASAFGDTSVTQNGDEAQVVLSAFDTSYNADDGGASNVNLLANNLNNEIIATNTGGTFSLYNGDDYFVSSQTAGSTIDRVIDGGEGYDVVEYQEGFYEGFVEKIGSIFKVGANSDTLTNVEEIRFANAIVYTNGFVVDYLNAPPVAVDDTFNIGEDQTLNGSVLDDNGSGSDSDPDGDPLTVSLISGPSDGVLNLSPDGSFTYAATGDAFDLASPGDTVSQNFTYEVDDGNGGTSQAIASIAVTIPQPTDPVGDGVVGSWQFAVADPLADDAPNNDNPVMLQEGAITSNGKAVLDGVESYLLVAPVPDYTIADGSVRIKFTADALSGVSGGGSFDSSFYQALFSRDSSGFDSGGHVTAYLNGDGSIVIRHQTDKDSYVVQTAPALVMAGQVAELTYAFDETDGMSVFLGLNGNTPQLVAQNADPVDDGVALSLIGNNEPWTIGASQARSGDGAADRLQNFFAGEIDNFEILAGSESDGGNMAPEMVANASAQIRDDESLALVVSAVDPDGDEIAYAIAGGSDADLFSIDPKSGVLSFIAQPDFDAPADADRDNVYSIVVTATDPLGLSATQNVEITVKDAIGPNGRNLIGSWQFMPDDPLADDAPGTNNPLELRNGAVAADGQAVLDGTDDFVLINSLPDYAIAEGSLQMTFTVGQLSGESGRGRFDDTDYQALFSRDSSGFDGGGHVTGYLNGDGSIVVRHQTQNDSYTVETAEGLVDVGDEIELIYTFDATDGMSVFVGSDGNASQLVAQNVDPITDGAALNLIGNEEPWTIGASQARSGDGSADRLQNFFNGEIDSFEIYSGSNDFIF